MNRTIALIGCLLLLLAGIAGMYYYEIDRVEMEWRTPILSKLYLLQWVVAAMIGLAGTVWILSGGELP